MSRSGFLGALCGFAFFVSGSASASTVFAPTDGDINFIDPTFPGGTWLAMFDDSDTSFEGSHLLIPAPEIVTVEAGGTNSGDFTARISGTTSPTLNLTGSDWFRLAISTDSGTSWSGDTGYDYLQANSYRVHFSNGSVLTVDVQVVPVPAAVWLFGSGLLGLAGIARRKNAA